MKILLLNGSPREGNTKFAIETICKGIDENISDAETDIINIADKSISCCIGCEACVGNGGTCIFEDDMVKILEKVRDADMLVFGSPVYWWGITAQLKTVIDRLFALSGNYGKKEKKIGIVHIGEDSLDGPQYTLISKQFDCICVHLGWDMVFDVSISAAAPDDIKNNQDRTQELASIWKKI